MNELKLFAKLLAEVKANEPLMRLIEEQESAKSRLRTLLQDSDYDPEEAIRLTNDIAYIAEILEQNPLYRSYTEAQRAIEQVNAGRNSKLTACGRQCPMCQRNCFESVENGEAK